MRMESYEQLLDGAYAALPERKSTGERFEMPRATVFIQGSKTIIKNFDFVCQRLRRTPRQLSKYLFNELAVPGSLAGKELVLQGKFNEYRVNDMILAYFNACVVCSECKRPDTRLEEQGRGVTLLVCEACGARKPVRV